MITDDGSRISRIVFLAESKKAPKVRSKSRRIKQWRCPACDKPVEADTLLDFESGWYTEDAGGRWWTKGICPHCFNRIQFTKSGAVVITTPHKPGEPWKPVRKTMVRRKEAAACPTIKSPGTLTAPSTRTTIIKSQRGKRASERSSK